jgi:hypothetical protein
MLLPLKTPEEIPQTEHATAEPPPTRSVVVLQQDTDDLSAARLRPRRVIVVK